MFRRPPPAAHCSSCHHWAHDLNAKLDRITTQLHRIENQMTESLDNQTHLDQDVSAISGSIATAVAELKAQIAAGTPSAALDFTGLDNLAAATAAEAVADAPVTPPTT